MKELAQLARLRALRVRRARKACAEQAAALEEAADIVVRRQAGIDRIDRSVNRGAQQAVGELAAEIGRWSGLMAAERARLLERRELETFMLADETVARDRTREALEAARRELARAIAREDMVDSLAAHARSERERRAERAVEAEGDDVIGARAAARGQAS